MNSLAPCSILRTFLSLTYVLQHFYYYEIRQDNRIRLVVMTLFRPSRGMAGL